MTDDRPERPGEDATSAEIAEWMERDFAWAVAEGAAKAGEQDDDGKEVEETGTDD